MVAWTEIRKISIATAALLAVLSAGARSRAQSQSASPTGEVSKLRILYAGRPGSDREKGFVTFLQEHFDTVRTGDLRTFQEADTRNVDVTLLDWDWNELNGPRPRLSESFSRPVMTLGVPGGVICDNWRLKTGYA